MTNYEELPEKLRDQLPEPSPDETTVWDEVRRCDPSDISTYECACCGEELFDVPVEPLDGGTCWWCGADKCLANDWGDVAHGEWVSDPGAPEMGYNLALEEDDDASTVMCGYCAEDFGRGNTLTLIDGDGGTYAVHYEGSVIRDASPYGEGDHRAVYDMPDHIWDMMSALVRGSRYVSTDAWRGYHEGPDEAGEMVKVSSGWHSSMERSEMSDRINALTRGEYHKDEHVYQMIEASDAVDAVLGGDLDEDDVEEVREEGVGLDVPVAVMFGRTSNVCSVGIDVYTVPSAEETVTALLESTPAPGHAGLR